jgi:hypothetical protein
VAAAVGPSLIPAPRLVRLDRGAATTRMKVE